MSASASASALHRTPDAPSSSRYRQSPPARRASALALQALTWTSFRSARRDQVRGLLMASERGLDSFSDLPRPDRLGLVMKYLCALNGSSPSAGAILSLEPSGNTR